ncbi:soluble P-type ATPase [Crenobacter luteus]|uniref:ATPase P n=1 Tax=Crenobacter luteus TaxID=1452487 RepID=A0A163CZQ5_9NEIS|nr:HAD family hydrolase [Crenobacter luteus]KZE33551.1 ATPase P [Crenobacter luteus]TCP13012.1 soluble P-type ATPase [Crenobacter luteus]
MISLDIPGFGQADLRHLVLDFNGTLACDGVLPSRLRARLADAPGGLTVHVLSGDTFGQAARQLGDLPCTLSVLGAHGQAQAKRDYVLRLGAEQTVAIGNGRNDRLMLSAAALGIAVLGPEGCAAQSVQAADLLVRDIDEAFALLAHPLRLVASLRD